MTMDIPGSNEDRREAHPQPWPGIPSGLIEVNPHGSAPFLLVADHAGAEIPAPLGTLGLAPADLARHIALDIGVWGLTRVLADRLDAVALAQRTSRLVIDCNRDPDAPDAIPELVDGTAIPGNRALDAAARTARIDAVHRPYHAAIAAEIARRAKPPVLVALHSFTPALADGARRPWAVGVLHGGGNDRFAHALLAGLRRRDPDLVGDNEPYRLDATDYTVPRHAIDAGLLYAEIEVRQDLLRDRAARWSAILGPALLDAYRHVAVG